MSVQFSGSLAITGSLVTTGQIIAQTLNVQQVTSSIIYSSGSNVFGNSLSNTQIMTGSVSVTGSLNVNGVSSTVGTGTTNFISKFTGASALGNSQVFDDGTSVGIGTTTVDIFGRFDDSYLTFSKSGNIALNINAGTGSGRGAQIYMGQGGTRHFTISSNSSESLITTVGNTPLRFGTNDGIKATLDASGNLMVGSTDSGNAGTINVSVGVAGTTAGGLQLWASTSQTHYLQFGDGATGAQPYAGYVGYAHSSDSLIFGTGAATKMTLNASGNLGLGVTPSAWSVVTGLQVLNANVSSVGGNTNNSNFGSNFYYDGTNFRYIGTSFATNLKQLNGGFEFYTAPSGTAGNPITFTQAMTLTAAGNLLIKTTSDNGTDALQVAGSGRFTSSVNVNGNTSTYPLAVKLDTNKNIGFRLNTDAEIVAINDALDNQVPLRIASSTWNISSAGAATFSSTVTAATLSTIGTAVAAQNVQLNLNGVSGKAQRIEFQNSGVQQWLLGAGAASETSAFEIFNSTGIISLSINKSTNAATFSGAGSFGGNLDVTKSNAVITVQSTNSGGYAVSRYMSSGVADLWYGRESSTSSIFGLTASSSVIYSEGAFPHIVFVNGAERTRISTGGRFLIGTTTDNGTDALQVAGSVGLSGTATTAINLTNGTFSYGLDMDNNVFLRQKNTSGILSLLLGASIDDNTYLRGFSGVVLQVNNGATNALSIASTGAATFSSSVTAGGKISANTGLNAVGFEMQETGTARFQILQEAGYTGNMIGNANINLKFSSYLIGGTGGEIIFYTQNNGTTTGVERLRISSTGAATFSSLGTGTVYSNGGTLTNTNPSDQNLKENIDDLGYGLDEILQLRPVTFTWKYDKINQGTQYGFIAQEVQEIMPDLVKDGEYLGLDKEAIFTTLVKAIQELKAENDTLKEILQRNNIQ